MTHALEAAVRRHAKKLNLTVQKSRSHGLRGYMLIDPAMNTWVAGGYPLPCCLTLSELVDEIACREAGKAHRLSI